MLGYSTKFCKFRIHLSKTHVEEEVIIDSGHFDQSSAG